MQQTLNNRITEGRFFCYNAIRSSICSTKAADE